MYDSISRQDNTEKFQINITQCDNVSLHIHSEAEIIFVLDGKIKVRISETEYTLESGSAAFIAPETLHSYMPAGNSSAKLCIITAGISALGSIGSLLASRTLKDPVIPGNILSERIPDLHKILKEFQGCSDMPLLPPHRFHAKLLILVLELISICKITERPHENDSLCIEVIQLCCAEYLDDSFNAEIAAKKLGISTTHLRRVFQKKMHFGIQHYITLLRLEHAASLLSDTDTAITEIAMNSGYESISSFNHAFLRNYGMSPSQYRKKHNQKNTRYF